MGSRIAEISKPATVVVAQRLKPGCEEAFVAWQETVYKAMAEFPGYMGAELLRPDSGGDDAWTTIYRFASVDRLKAWVDSEELQRLQEQAADLFVETPTRQILLNEHKQETVTIVISHRVKPGDEEQFRAFQERINAVARGFPGFRADELLKPVPGIQDEWTVLYRFDTAKHADAWLQSPERKRLLAEQGGRFADFQIHRVSPRYGSWFSALEPTGQDSGPPAWKSALAVLAGLYPTVFLITLAQDEVWPDAALWVGLLIGSFLGVAALTWVVMPVVTRLLRFWLAPPPLQAGPRRDALGAAVSIAFLTVVAAVFWLFTTQVWTLP